jgi:beta-lactamase class A
MSKSVIALLFATAVVSSLVTYFVVKHFDEKVPTSDAAFRKAKNSAASCNFDVLRQPGYRFIKPVQFVNGTCESDKYQSLKNKIAAEIKSNIDAKKVINASVYFRDMEESSWFAINPEMKYHPGSLMKLPILMTYLKLEEEQKGILNKKIMNNMPDAQFPGQTYTSLHIEKGKEYSVKDLLSYMIKYSDNNATGLLLKNINVDAYLKMYDDLHLPRPDVKDFNYTITPVDYSVFIRAIFNGSYLNNQYSEYAAELLAECNFDRGIVAGIPKDTPVAHKFGEWSDGATIFQLHEAGIIYVNGKAYIVVIMTNGNDTKILPDVVRDISKVVYNHLDDPSVPDTTF